MVFSGQRRKVAFLFLTVEDVHRPDLWRDFFFEGGSSELHPDVNIYAHVKHRSRLNCESSFLSKYMISKHEPTQWGSISLVKATLYLLEEAVCKDPDNFYFVLLSESCIPLYPMRHFLDLIRKEELSQIDMTPSRYPENGLKERYDRFLGKHLISSERFVKSHQWIIWNRDDAEFFCHWPMFQEFSRMFAPDEHYFVNVMRYHNRPFHNIGRTFTDWETQKSHPKSFEFITADMIQSWRNQQYFFARKICAETRFLPSMKCDLLPLKEI